MSTPTVWPRKLYLASQSRYRAALLRQLNVPFEQRSPNCDESPLAGESLADLVTRLSAEKAQAILPDLPDSDDGIAIVIGSDQVADCHGELIGKPGNRETAIEQLKRVSGQKVVFRTGLCVIDTQNRRRWEESVDTEARFRELTDDEIERYLSAESPFDCACSFRLEGLGPSLLESMSSTDPSALIGLPLIKLSGILRDIGFSVP